MKHLLDFFNPDNIKGYDGFIDMLLQGLLYGALPKILAAISLGIFVYLIMRKRANMAAAILFYAIAFALTYLTQFFKFLM